MKSSIEKNGTGYEFAVDLLDAVVYENRYQCFRCTLLSLILRVLSII